MRSLKKTVLFVSVVAAAIMTLSVVPLSFSTIDAQTTAQEGKDVVAQTYQPSERRIATTTQANDTSIPFTEEEIFMKILEVQEQRDSVRSNLVNAIESGNEAERLMNQGRLYELDNQIAQLDAILQKISPIEQRGVFEMKETGSAGAESGVSLRSIIQEAYAENPWVIADLNHGCTGFTQSWIAQGAVDVPDDTTHLSIDYPATISVGLSPFCSATNWDSFGFDVQNFTQDWECVSIPAYQVFNEDEWDATCIGYYMNSGDWIKITTSGNYDLWALGNQRFWTATP